MKSCPLYAFIVAISFLGTACSDDEKLGCASQCVGASCDETCGESEPTAPDDECGPDGCEDGGPSECIPDCEDRECGDDGCGGQCGDGCASGESCDESTGICFGVCVPDEEPCGGSCAAGERCDVQSDSCVTCTPQCEGRTCGGDGCGGQCGDGCAPGQRCDATSGTCGQSVIGQAYWRFEEINGGEIFDSSPLALHGSLEGPGVSTTAVPVDLIPQSRENNIQALDLGWLDVTNGGYILVPDEDRLLTLGNRDFTIEAWVKLDQLSDTSDGNQRQVLVQKKRDSSPDKELDYMVLVQRGALSPEPNFGKNEDFSGREIQLIFGTGGTTWGITSNLEINDTEWHFVSIAFNAISDAVRFGLDNTFETIPFEANPRAINDGPLRIGSHQGANGNSNHFLRGSIDELRISRDFLPTEHLLNAPMPDCNGNDVWDLVEAVETAGADCNDNLVPDACEISAGLSEDCQGDGVPDECQLRESLVLSYDGGAGGVGWRADEPYMAWMNHFTVSGGAGTVDAIEVLYGKTPDGTELSAYVWSDPDGDGNPRDAQVLWTEPVQIDRTDYSTRVEVPDVYVGGNGASFFVGFVVTTAIYDEFPAILDISGVPNHKRSWGVGANDPIDPNDLANEAVEFGPIDDLLFAGNWVLSAHMLAPGNDCNANGTPDSCDIAAQPGIDSDCSGVLDACEACGEYEAPQNATVSSFSDADCNDDGVADCCLYVANDCDNDGVPDIQQLDENDCNQNGVLDACDISSALSVDVDESGIPDECEDCNGNGILDSEDISSGTSEDCTADDIPDECQLGALRDPIVYALDDGTRESQLNIQPSVIESVWMHRYTVEEGAEWIGSISIVWADTFPGRPARLLIWSDPDGDGNPTDAQLLFSKEIRTQNVGEVIWNRESITPTYIGPVGTSFFVGAYYDAIYGSTPIAIDATTGAGQKWVAYALDPAVLDLNALATEQVGAGLFPMNNLNFFIRAEGFDGSLTQDCDGNGIPDSCQEDVAACDG